MKCVKNKLRVVHFPQLGSCKEFFSVPVPDEKTALLVFNALANQHLWLLEHNIIPDYSNVIFVEMFDKTIDEETNQPYAWNDYYNEEEDMDWDEFVEAYLN